ncbi:MAG: methyltransferase domain-containing protein [Pseudomonadota bacterium]
MSDYQEYYITRKPSNPGMRAMAFWHRRMLKIAERHIPNLLSKTVLEIGPGHGLFAEACQQKQLAYFGLEMNVEQARALQLAGHKVSSATIPPIPAGEPVQMIWLSHVLEHAGTYHEAKLMLQACHDRLDNNGLVIIIAPDINHWREEFWSVDWSHGFPTSLNRVEQLLSETGFSVAQSMHHTFTLTNTFLAWLLSWLFRLGLPVNLLDYFFKKWTGRQFAHAFMSVFGLRQIYVIGEKHA